MTLASTVLCAQLALALGCGSGAKQPETRTESPVTPPGHDQQEPVAGQHPTAATEAIMNEPDDTSGLAPGNGITEGELLTRAVTASELEHAEEGPRIFTGQWIDALRPDLEGSLAAIEGERFGVTSTEVVTLERPRLLLVNNYPHRRSDANQQHRHRVMVIHPDGAEGRIEATDIFFQKWGGPPDREGLARVATLLARYARQ